LRVRKRLIRRACVEAPLSERFGLAVFSDDDGWANHPLGVIVLIGHIGMIQEREQAVV
jgi:hypothetical protein